MYDEAMEHENAADEMNYECKINMIMLSHSKLEINRDGLKAIMMIAKGMGIDMLMIIIFNHGQIR